MKENIVVLNIARPGTRVSLREQLATFSERLAGRERVQRFLHWMGLDPRQFVLFLGLFRTLSEREEFMGSVGVNRFNISYIALFAGGLGVIPWSWMATGIADDRMPRIPGSGMMPESEFLLLNLAVTFIFTFLIMIRETANAVFNPVEASMMAHSPIHSPTYAAAKITYILVAVTYIVVGLNAYPALISAIFWAFKMFPGGRWFFPITLLVAASLIGLWTAFVICAFYGLLRRLAPAGLLKGIAMWVQWLSVGALVAVPIFFPGKFFGSFLGGLLTAGFENTWWTWLPLAWFAEIGRMGCFGASWRLGWQGSLSMAATLALVWFGLRSFSGNYLSETIFAGRDRFWKRRDREFLSRCGAAVGRAVTGSAVGIGAFCFLSRMIRRDWLFRRFVGMQTWIPLLAILGIVLGIGRFGVPSAISGRQSIEQILPHLLALVAMALCINLPFTVFSKASWIYLTAPMGSARSYARGIFWALWFPAAALPCAALLVFLATVLNWEDAAFMAGFDLIVVSLYLAFEIRLVTKLPFSSPGSESRAMGNGIYIQIYWILAILIPLIAHQALCERLWVALLATIALLLITIVVLRINLKKVEKEILWRLYEMRMGSGQMFREIDN